MERSYTLLQLFHDGGGWMYPILLCSLFALGAIFAKAYTLWVAERHSRHLLDRALALGRAGRIEEAVELTERTPGPVAAVLHAGLRRYRDRFEIGEIEAALTTTGVVELGFLERGLVVLATVSNVAPLLGFLGTVAGMISAFGAIAAAGQVEARLVAGGIKVALITTAAGLIIAIPVNVAHNFFVTRIDKLIRSMAAGTAQVLNLVWDQSAAAGGAVAVAADLRPDARPAAGAASLRHAARPASRRKRVSGEIPTASMADIAFLLLIFFLTTTVFDEEKGLEIVLPESEATVTVAQKNVIHLLVQADGLVQVKRGESPQIQQTQSSEIASIWRQAAANNPNLIAAVKTSPAAPYRYMIDVLDQLRKAGADRISLQVLE